MIRIGTSGWVYPHWRGIFYPASLPQRFWFGYYAERFDTVEINNSFYRLPTTTAFDAWRRQAPARFTFAVKASRYLTHMKKLKDPEEPVQLFFDRARHLGPHLGPVLYQLPPRWGPDLDRFEHFLKTLPRNRLHAVEFREPRWLAEPVFQMLERFRVALCVHDLGNIGVPGLTTASFAYVRFHGGPGHGGRYSDPELESWAGRIADWHAAGISVYAYFNNDVGGHAIANALRLRQLLVEECPEAINIEAAATL